MMTKTNEIADGIFRFSTCVPGGVPGGFTFNQFLIKAEEPLLFHTGPRALFPLISEAVSRVVPIETLRWITFGHVEADECGSMNQWLEAAPRSEVAHGAVGVMVSLNDLANRPPRALQDGEIIDLGGRRVRDPQPPLRGHRGAREKSRGDVSRDLSYANHWSRYKKARRSISEDARANARIILQRRYSSST